MSIQLIYPIAHYLTGDLTPYRTQKFGNPTSYGFHEGADYAAYVGQPVWASQRGKIERVKYDMSTYHAYGIHCWINHGDGYWTAYCHLDKLEVDLNQLVQPHQQLGLAGSTGNSTGPHLHWNLTYNQRYLDPEKYLVGTTPAIPADARSTYTPTANQNVRQTPSLTGLRLTTIPAGRLVYLTSETQTDGQGYKWGKLASGQSYGAVDISAAWLALDYTECTIKVFGKVGLL
jgi:murein DD-endopeptidase MepM/ murein hydrolase activator NlpD